MGRRDRDRHTNRPKGDYRFLYQKPVVVAIVFVRFEFAHSTPFKGIPAALLQGFWREALNPAKGKSTNEARRPHGERWRKNRGHSGRGETSSIGSQLHPGRTSPPAPMGSRSPLYGASATRSRPEGPRPTRQR